jgi:hypothetical protein
LICRYKRTSKFIKSFQQNANLLPLPSLLLGANIDLGKAQKLALSLSSGVVTDMVLVLELTTKYIFFNIVRSRTKGHGVCLFVFISPTSSGRSVGIVRLKATEFVLFVSGPERN